MKKIWMGVASCMLAGTLLLPFTIYAASPMGNGDHTDTQDYCLRAFNVTIGLTEIQSCPDEAEVHRRILQAASPAILIREKGSRIQHWRKLELSSSVIFKVYVTDDVRSDEVKMPRVGILSSEKEGIRTTETLLLSTGSIATAGIGASIVSDLRILKWYSQKKAERRKHV